MPELFAQAYDLESKTEHSPIEALSVALEAWTRPRWPVGTPWFSPDEPRALRAPDGSIFRWEPFADGGRRLLEFTWRHPHNGAPSVQWSTRVAFAVLEDRLHVSIRVSNTGPAIGHPNALLTTRPRLLLTLADFFLLRSTATTTQPDPIILSDDDFTRFVRYELFDPTRRYPIALLSPMADNEYVVSPALFGREFMGIAKTYRAESAASTFALTAELGRKDLSCFHGAMRIYMPGLERESNPRHHPLILPRRLATSAERLRIAQALTIRTVAGFEDEAFIAQLRDERAVAADERRTGLVTLVANLQKAASDSDDFRNLAEAYSEQNAQLAQDLEQLREDLEEAHHKISALQYALNQRDVGGATAAPDTPVFAPADVVDAVEQAGELFPDDLLILPSAVEAAEASPYRSPADVAEALAAIAEVSKRLKRGKLGRKMQDVFAEMNMDYGGGLAPTTPKKTRKKYVFVDGDQKYACEEHLRVGGGSYDPVDSLRIYFTTKQRSHGRIAVGHVGRHLDVISTT